MKEVKIYVLTYVYIAIKDLKKYLIISNMIQQNIKTKELKIKISKEN